MFSLPSFYDNHPLSRFRPPLRFLSKAEEQPDKPLLSVITATQNPREVFLRTAEFVLSQSFASFEWIIVDDHSTSNVRFLLVSLIFVEFFFIRLHCPCSAVLWPWISAFVYF